MVNQFIEDVSSFLTKQGAEDLGNAIAGDLIYILEEDIESVGDPHKYLDRVDLFGYPWATFGDKSKSTAVRAALDKEKFTYKYLESRKHVFLWFSQKDEWDRALELLGMGRNRR